MHEADWTACTMAANSPLWSELSFVCEIREQHGFFPMCEMFHVRTYPCVLSTLNHIFFNVTPKTHQKIETNYKILSEIILSQIVDQTSASTLEQKKLAHPAGRLSSILHLSAVKFQNTLSNTGIARGATDSGDFVSITLWPALF